MNHSTPANVVELNNRSVHDSDGKTEKNSWIVQAAYDRLDPQRWVTTDLAERLGLLREVQENLKRHCEELARANAAMKNAKISEVLYRPNFAMASSVAMDGSTIAATIQLYEALVHGKMPSPGDTTPVRDGMFDVQVFPRTSKDKFVSGALRGHLRIKGVPRQVNPLVKPSGVIAIFGMGNFCSSMERIKALFWENKTVIYKPHPINARAERIWEKILEPLVRHGALSFVPDSDGQALTQLPGLTAIYFTGSAQVANMIANATTSPVIAECGGNNPCIVVPGDRPWTKDEIRHQALHLVSMAKFNGGAQCGRPQTIVMSRHWPQRKLFLDAIRDAIANGTFATGTFYPGSGMSAASFATHPGAERLQPENGQHKSGEFLFVTDVGVDSAAHQREAFCQVLCEVALDVPASADQFLPAAVIFCNEKLIGSLTCTLLVDDDTFASRRADVNQAIDDLRYGVIAVNSHALPAVLTASLTWGGNDHGAEIASGSGNFGNVLGFQNVVKSVLYDRFVSPTHILMTSKAAFESTSRSYARYLIDPTWPNALRMVVTAVAGRLRSKDF